MGTRNNVYGEGNYEATRDYERRTKDYLKSADVEEDARHAAPRDEKEAREMEQAEAEGKRHDKTGSAAANDRKDVDSGDA